MGQEVLQTLVTVYNTLFNITVTGNAIIPMAQALTLLQGVILNEAEHSNNSQPTESDLDSE